MWLSFSGIHAPRAKTGSLGCELELILPIESFSGISRKPLTAYDLLPSISLLQIMSPLHSVLLTFLFVMVLSAHVHSVRAPWLLQAPVLRKTLCTTPPEQLCLPPWSHLAPNKPCQDRPLAALTFHSSSIRKPGTVLNFILALNFAPTNILLGSWVMLLHLYEVPHLTHVRIKEWQEGKYAIELHNFSQINYFPVLGQ